MGLQQEDAVLNVRVNGEPAAASIKEMTGQIKYLTTAIEGMHKADNPALYASRASQLNALKAARDAERASIEATKHAVQQQQEAWQNAFGTIKNAIGGLGIAAAVGLLASFGKELFNIEVKASGINNAFAKIGNTTGLLEKLRTASRGLISDLDLEKMAIKANNANIPLDKMGLLLQFAQQRARDTGEDVTELTEKLITGLGKNGTRSVAGLGISVKEVKLEFQKTGDMVTAVTNVIQRQMLNAGKDVDDFGDIVLAQGTKWENLKNKLAGFWAKLFKPELADSDAIQKQTNKEMEKFAELQKFSDDQLDKAIEKQNFRQTLYGKNLARSQKALDDAKKAAKEKDGDQAVNNDFSEEEEQAKKAAEQYQGVRNALIALNKEKEKRTVKQETESEKGTVDYIDKEIDALKKEQSEVSKTSAEWKKYAAEIKKLQDERDRITGKKDKKGESDAARALKDFKRLAEEQKQFEAADLAAHLAKNEKEIEQEKNKYDVFIQKEKDFLKEKGVTGAQRVATAANISKLEAEKENAVIELRAKQEKELAERINQFREQLNGKLETELQKEKDQINKHYDEEVKNAGTNAQQLIAIAVARAVAISEAEEREHKRLIAEKTKLQHELKAVSGDNKEEDSIAKITEDAASKLEALDKEFSAEEKKTQQYADAVVLIEKIKQEKIKAIRDQQTKAEINAGIQAAQDVANAVEQISANNRHAQEQAQMTSLEKQRSAELNNKNLTQSQIDQINQRYDKQAAELKKQAFEADKKASIEQALINGALAITKTFADYGFTPFGWIAAGAQAVATGAQIAVISAQPTPQFSDGGILPDGPSHAAGGINLVGPYGKILGQIEGGEPIISKQTFANNRGVVNALLQSRGGPVDVDKVNQATASRELRHSGGGGASAGGNGSGGKVTPNQHFDPSELISEMRLTRIAIQEKELKISRRAWDIETDKVNQIRNNANG